MNMDNIYEPDAGYIYRNKNNPNDFSSWLHIGTGVSIDDYELVPISVYEQHLAEQEKMITMETTT